jgi:hypothetical protein
VGVANFWLTWQAAWDLDYLKRSNQISEKFLRYVSLANPSSSIEIEIEIVYNMYRVKPNVVFGPSQLRKEGTLQAGARP